VPEIGIALSLSVIVGVLVVTTIASLVAVRRNPALAHPPAAAEDETPALAEAR